MMGEEITYATVVIKDGGQSPNENKEKPTVYVSVKPKQAALTSSDGGADAGCSHVHVLALCAVILFLILLGTFALLIYLRLLIDNQRAQIIDLGVENEKLDGVNFIMKANIEKMTTLADNLNWTLNVILSFDNFPVDAFCPDKKCQPCLNEWIHFQNKCYFFYEKSDPWKEWDASRSYCQKKKADLVVVDSLQEQEFISNHTKFYYDEIHGYWMGLKKNSDGQWVWLDRRNDTLGFWVKEELGTPGPFGLLIPQRDPTDSWDQAENAMRNKFICESAALIRVDGV